MNAGVVGCGRWGSFIAWYLDGIGHDVTLYARKESARGEQLISTRTNGLVTLDQNVKIVDTLCDLNKCDTIFVSIASQNLREFCRAAKDVGLKNKTFVLCMKGLEIGTGKRLSVVAEETLDKSDDVAVWLGPGHVQEFTAGVPNCMVIDSRDETVKETLIKALSGGEIRFYYGSDIIGNEIGAAAKNVVGIAAGMLDGMGLGSLKGALMSRGAREIARLIKALGGNELSAYGLCHLGDYEATVFSPYSHNRAFGEKFVRGESYGELAEGYFTVRAVTTLACDNGVELPICEAVHGVLYEGADFKAAFDKLFLRSLKREL